MKAVLVARDPEHKQDLCFLSTAIFLVGQDLC